MSDKKHIYKHRGLYKSCVVPECTSTSVSTPDKLFISLPNDKNTRRAWQRAMRRIDFVSDKGSRYCCQDHFNVEEDIENYMYLKTMKSGRIKVKQGVLPHIFNCQKKRKISHSSKPRSFFKQKVQKVIIEDATCEVLKNEIYLPEQKAEQEATISTKICDQGVLVNLKPKKRSKLSQTIHCTSNYQSNKKFKLEILNESPQIKRKLKNEHNCDEEQKSNDLSASTTTFSTSLSSLSGIIVQPWNSKEYIEKRSMYVIENNPELYIGIPSRSMFIVDMLSEKCKRSKLDIYVTLKKIKLNLPDSILADDFCISTTAVCTIIQEVIPLMAQYLKPFIEWKTLSDVKDRLPILFRYKYKNVQSIIDCLEVSICDPISQSLSSFDNNSKTIKYLISCTPDGLISFVSKGFDGRISDEMIAKESFLYLLEPGGNVMAGRGFQFKHIEELAIRNNKLVKPPSASSDRKIKQEITEANSLRIHIERVISRIREFHFLQPHAQIQSSLIDYLDFIVQIVCGLINLRNDLVK